MIQRTDRALATARLRLEGVIAPVPLALDEQQEIDESGLRCEVRRLLGAGVNALLVNGGTGEGVMISPEESRRVCEIVVAEAAGRVPVVAGVIADSTRQAIALGRLARQAGAAALLVAPVHFLLLPTRAGIVDFYRAIGDELGLPLVLYNCVPQIDLAPDLCLELAELPQVVAVKHSNEDFSQLAHLLHVAGDRIAVLAAIEDLLLPSLVLGAPGIMPAIAAVLPDQCVALYRAVRRGDLPAALALHRRLLPVVQAVVTRENFPATLKLALRLLGRRVGPARSPLTAPDAQVEAAIASALAAAGALDPD
jgi:4-hydroxy-tetrahydrodipicolinate synthase